MVSNKLFDETNSSNPWLIDIRKDELLIDDTGNKLSSSYIWSKQGAEREKLVQWVFAHYRQKGFPFPKLSEEELLKKFGKLKTLTSAFDEKSGILKNSNSQGLDILKHFCGELFYCTKADGGRSTLEVFHDDELLLKVLKNRMGWCSTTEDGTERPFVFGMTDAMLIQGIRSSGLAKSISQFKISVAQSLYKMYCPLGGTILDFSAGWGARALAAASLGYFYYGIDPLTADCLNKMMLFFNSGNGWIVKGKSEDKNIYQSIPEVDFVFSCPPYFSMERFSIENSQCYNAYPDYSDWLNQYWQPTVKNCLDKLRSGGYFCFVIIDRYKEDMVKVCEDLGLHYFNIIDLSTSKSHLSGKRESGLTTKNTEAAVVLTKSNLTKEV